MGPDFDKLQIKRELQAARQEIAKSLDQRDQVLIEQVADTMDQVQAAGARELAIGNLDRSARWLRQVEDAIRRLEAGEYGTCANCEEEISRKRLRAIPWAQLCLRCQEIADQTELGEGGRGAAHFLMNAA